MKAHVLYTRKGTRVYVQNCSWTSCVGIRTREFVIRYKAGDWVFSKALLREIVESY